MSSTPTDLIDRDSMNEALDEWSEDCNGEPNYADPCRPDFISGWRDQRAGKAPSAPSDVARQAGYNSGYIAARETLLVSSTVLPGRLSGGSRSEQ